MTDEAMQPDAIAAMLVENTDLRAEVARLRAALTPSAPDHIGDVNEMVATPSAQMEGVMRAAAFSSSEHRYDIPSALSGDAGEGSGWQPIETAPKDGTRILVAFDERKGNRVDAAHWRRNLRGDGGYFSSHIVEAVSGKKHMRENQPIRWKPMPVFAALPSHQGAGG